MKNNIYYGKIYLINNNKKIRNNIFQKIILKYIIQNINIDIIINNSRQIKKKKKY